MKPHQYQLRAGVAPESAALTSLLAGAGLLRSDTQQPFSEAMVLGIGGGIGIGYILWEFKASAMRILVMGMRNKWQYAMTLPEKLEQRLGVRLAVAETAGARGAQAALDASLGLGRPAMLWVDAAHLPYRHLPSSMAGVCGHTLVTYESEVPDYLVDDRSRLPFRLSRTELEAARNRIPSYKNRLLAVEEIDDYDLAAAVRAGLADCAVHLAEPSESFSLPVIRKWARLMTDKHNTKGWPRVFSDGQGLFSTLASIFDNVSDYGSTGGSLRGLYADFLEEAATVLAMPALRGVALQYRQLAILWGSLGETALPTEVSTLAQAKSLMARRYMIYAEQGGEGLTELAEIGEELDSLRTAGDRAFPLDPAGTLELFKSIQVELFHLHEAEVQANSALQAALI